MLWTITLAYLYQDSLMFMSKAWVSTYLILASPVNNVMDKHSSLFSCGVRDEVKKSLMTSTPVVRRRPVSARWNGCHRIQRWIRSWERYLRPTDQIFSTDRRRSIRIRRRRIWAVTIPTRSIRKIPSPPSPRPKSWPQQPSRPARPILPTLPCSGLSNSRCQ